MTQPPGQPQGWWQPQTPGHGYPAPGQQQYPGQQQPQQHQYPQQPQQHQQAQQPQQPGNFGGNFQSQYGGLGAFGGEPPAKPKRSKKPLVIGLVVVVVLGGGAAAAWFGGLFRGDVLQQQSLQDNVATVLRDSYGEHDVSGVECPADQKIQTGNTFECSVQVAGKRKAVAIRVLNDKPEYEVGAPK
ncbi:DUF4333 domain-containing protein [Prauserella cavernicola]|uniref:DUF4333 domain-containing protein n=1 Tax=Prauserella cavernicola TaxID=2800127 RepID=A0A934V1V8_9PSEU|nr:DUF4333 domain-containing protein [Prauserella cavernicola]MBK1784001.1 DUF4333 domain-containing protein [Prauserella cavernicola]